MFQTNGPGGMNISEELPSVHSLDYPGDRMQVIHESIELLSSLHKYPHILCTNTTGIMYRVNFYHTFKCALTKKKASALSSSKMLAFTDTFIDPLMEMDQCYIKNYEKLCYFHNIIESIRRTESSKSSFWKISNIWVGMITEWL